MACNSVAVTSANVVVKLSFAEMESILRSVLGASVSVTDYLSFAGFYGSRIPDGERTDAVAHLENGDRVVLTQIVNGKDVQHMFLFDNGSKSSQGAAGVARLEAEKERLLPRLNKALAVGNQRAVLKRLGQLGKLSQIQQKDQGVVATLTVNA